MVKLKGSPHVVNYFCLQMFTVSHWEDPLTNISFCWYWSCTFSIDVFCSVKRLWTCLVLCLSVTDVPSGSINKLSSQTYLLLCFKALSVVQTSLRAFSDITRHFPMKSADPQWRTVFYQLSYFVLTESCATLRFWPY